jgi:antitoxin (DNA-binding transcriptional repressor) of toxin-antitoxin stability system
MRTITPLDLRRSLGRILDEASAGQRFLIERDRHPLAVLISVEESALLDEPPDEARARRLAAIEALEAFRERIAGAKDGPDGGQPTAAELVRRGRDELDERDRHRSSRPPAEGAGRRDTGR